MIQKLLVTIMNVATGAKGATMAEYALVVAVIALIVIASAAIFGQNLLAIYESFKL
jgi:Flp pilus assembly pilin Flp